VSDNLEAARVAAAAQYQLFPNTRELCDEIGLKWWASLKLYEDDLLSFPPEATPWLNEAQEAELRFVGALVAAGCAPGICGQLLEGLTKPYSYLSNRIYYDWPERCWRLLPEYPKYSEDPEEIFSEWVVTMKKKDDLHMLEKIAKSVSDAIAQIKRNQQRSR
jgi:hypothetical protein